MDESKKVIYSVGVAALIILLFTVSAGPPFVNIIAGFFPLLITLLIAISTFQLKRPIPNTMAFGIPIFLSVLLGLMGALGDTLLFGQLETWYLAIANMIGGLAVMAIITDFMLPSPLARTPSHIKTHIQDAVRYTFAINEVINRVFSTHKGATQQVRKKLLLSTVHAQQLEKAFAKKQYQKAHTLVFELYEELRRLFEREYSLLGVIHMQDVSKEPNGQSRIIDILINNDFEPIRRYVESLTYALQNLNSELLEVRKK